MLDLWQKLSLVSFCLRKASRFDATIFYFTLMRNEDVVGWILLLLWQLKIKDQPNVKVDIFREGKKSCQLIGFSGKNVWLITQLTFWPQGRPGGNQINEALIFGASFLVRQEFTFSHLNNATTLDEWRINSKNEGTNQYHDHSDRFIYGMHFCLKKVTEVLSNCKSRFFKKYKNTIVKIIAFR